MDIFSYLFKLALVLVLLFVLSRILYGHFIKKINEIVFSESDYDTLDKYLKKFLVRGLIPLYYHYYSRINFCIVNKDTKHLEEVITKVGDAVVLDDNKIKEVYLNAFSYFCTEDNREYANYCYKKLKKLEDSSLKEEIKQMYKVYILHDMNIEQDLIDLCSKSSVEVKVVYLERLAVLYMRNNYTDLASKCVNQLLELAKTDGEKERYKELLNTK